VSAGSTKQIGSIYGRSRWHVAAWMADDGHEHMDGSKARVLPNRDDVESYKKNQSMISKIKIEIDLILSKGK
jgi:hypothetical protein